MRNVTHNLYYSAVNSNTMQNMAHGAVVKVIMPPWMKMLIAADVLTAVLFAGGVV